MLAECSGKQRDGGVGGMENSIDQGSSANPSGSHVQVPWQDTALPHTAVDTHDPRPKSLEVGPVRVSVKHADRDGIFYGLILLAKNVHKHHGRLERRSVF